MFSLAGSHSHLEFPRIPVKSHKRLQITNKSKKKLRIIANNRVIFRYIRIRLISRILTNIRTIRFFLEYFMIILIIILY